MEAWTVMPLSARARIDKAERVASLWKAYALAYRQWHLTPDESEARIAETWAEFKKAEKALQDAGELT